MPDRRRPISESVLTSAKTRQLPQLSLAERLRMYETTLVEVERGIARGEQAASALRDLIEMTRREMDGTP